MAECIDVDAISYDTPSMRRLKGYISRLAARGMGTSYRYAGGDLNEHARWWRLRYSREHSPPAFVDTCPCGQSIVRQMYIESVEAPGFFVTIGSCCIKHFCGKGSRRRTCSSCSRPHKRRISALCSDCEIAADDLRRIREARAAAELAVAARAFARLCETVMPVGKFRGKPYSVIPPDYLRWILANFPPDSPAHIGLSCWSRLNPIPAGGRSYSVDDLYDD